MTILSSVYAKGVKRVQNAILQAITDAINLFLINRGARSYLNNFVLKMKAPLSQEEKDYRENLTNQITAISNMNGLFTDIEDKARRLEILKQLVGTLNYGDGLIQEIDNEIEAVKAKQKEEAEAAAAEEAANADMSSEDSALTSDKTESSSEESGGDDLDLGMSSVATTEESFMSNGGSSTLVEGPDFLEDDEDLPTPEQADESIDFTENK